METNVLAQKWTEVETDALVVLAGEENGDGAPGARVLQEGASGAQQWVNEAYASGEFRGKLLEFCLLHHPPGFQARRLFMVGAGKQEELSPAVIRKAAGAAVRELKSRRIQRVAMALPAQGASPEAVAAAVEGALLGNFETDKFKTDRDEAKTCQSFTVVVPQQDEGMAEGARLGRIVGEAQNYARDLANEPGNRLTPTVLSDKARALAEECRLECEVLDRDRMAQLGMGALLGVAQGSAEPPALIILRYQPPALAAKQEHLALIGKGVTFDTGGISIKPSENMEKMKYDMSGGAAVMGAMRAIAALQPPLAVTAFIPAVENMPGSKAQRPGDIVTTLAGKTVEVINTDAEGRLILIDAMTYAKRIGCTHLVDAATLTGAIAVALGFVNVGVFTNNEGFAGRLLAAAKAEGEKMWLMPLDEEYKDLLKNPYADLSNVGGRWGGAISAAYFLKEFAEDTPWIHLDIAGTAWLEESKPWMAKGPSGVGVRTMVRLALDWN